MNCLPLVGMSQSLRKSGQFGQGKKRNRNKGKITGSQSLRKSGQFGQTTKPLACEKRLIGSQSLRKSGQFGLSKNEDELPKEETSRNPFVNQVNSDYKYKC